MERVHAGAVLERCDWRQSEPPLRPQLRPLRLRCSGEYAVHNWSVYVIFDKASLCLLHFQLSVCLQEFLFGTVTEWLNIYNVYLYCSLWVLNGLLQSAVWPCVVAVMGNWFGKTGYV